MVPADGIEPPAPLITNGNPSSNSGGIVSSVERHPRPILI